MRKIKITTTIFIFLIFGIGYNTSAQSWKKPIKDNVKKNVNVKTNKLLDETIDAVNSNFSKHLNSSEKYIADKFKKQWKKTITNFAESYDVTDFNYAISFGDNSTPYEAKGNGKQARSFAYYLAEPENVRNTPPKIKAQNFNYTGEILYQQFGTFL